MKRVYCRAMPVNCQVDGCDGVLGYHEVTLGWEVRPWRKLLHWPAKGPPGILEATDCMACGTSGDSRDVWIEALSLYWYRSK